MRDDPAVRPLESDLPDRHSSPPLRVPRPFYSIFTASSTTDVDLLPADDIFYGDTYQLPKPTNIFRASVKNVNHVSTSSIDAQITLLCKDQEKYEIDLQGIIEHKCDMTKYHVHQAFDNAARQVHHPVRLELGSSEYQSIMNYKPGDTLPSLYTATQQPDASKIPTAINTDNGRM
jgi:hypothetical protein